jgi:hypothetical protein
MERSMRAVLLSVTAVFVGVVAAGNNSVSAAPLATLKLDQRPALVEPVDYWRRYCRRYGCPPPVVVPDVAPPVVDAVPEVGAVPVVPVVPLPPPRPLSCGEYRYWNGEACVDARYNNPYLGPK